MNPVFINTGNTPFDLSDVDYSHYNLGAELRACDSPNVVLSKDTSSTHEKVIESVSFILRTLKGNLLVSNTNSNKVVFEVKAHNKLPEGITLNDFMLFSAKEFLTSIIYPNYDIKDIAINAIPIPFGVIKRADNTHEALFQIVVNDEVLKNLNEGFSYVPVKDLEDNEEFNKILPQFKYTKEE